MSDIIDIDALHAELVHEQRTIKLFGKEWVLASELPIGVFAEMTQGRLVEGVRLLFPTLPGADGEAPFDQAAAVITAGITFEMLGLITEHVYGVDQGEAEASNDS